MKKLLVKFDSNWADEMDIDGFQVMTEDEFEKYKDTAKEAFKKGNGWSYGIGTNESIDYESVEGFFRDLKIQEISEDDYHAFKKHFATYNGFIKYGKFPDIEYFECYMEDFED